MFKRRKLSQLITGLGILIFSGTLFLKSAGLALAQGGTPGGGGQPGSLTLPNPLGSNNPSIMTIINNILNYLIYISVPIFAMMILIGGFQILTARDNPQKITSGRNTIMYAAIGFVIILISKGVALILLTVLGASTG